MTGPKEDRCASCGSESLFSGFFDTEGLAVPNDSQPGWAWTTFCNDCGAEWDPPHPRKARPARARVQA